MAFKATNTRCISRGQRGPFKTAYRPIVTRRALSVHAAVQRDQATTTTSRTAEESSILRRTLLAGVTAVAATGAAYAG